MYLFDSLYNCEDSCDNIQIGKKGKVIEESSVHLEEKLQSLIINYKKTQISKLLITINVRMDISHQESVHDKKASSIIVENVNENTLYIKTILFYAL